MQWLKLSPWKIRNRGFLSRSGIQVQGNKMFLLAHSRFNFVGSLRQSGPEFEVLCLEGSVISPSSEGSPGSVYMCTKVA